MALKIKDKDLEPELNQKGELTIDDPDIKHLFEKTDLMAIWAAYHAGRPLLLRGKPGTGKSQLAKAIAHKLGWAFVSETMHGSKELDELHWHYDAINRLGEAQSLAYQATAAQENKTEAEVKDILAHENYICPGSFWWAFDWKSAKAKLPSAEAAQTKQPHVPADWNEETGGIVLLIDEIDKAEPDLPNGLLQTLGDLEFTVPYINKRIKGNPEHLLIILTTNEERELPSALVRRCYTHTLKMEDKETTRIEWLVKRGKLHFDNEIDDAVYEEAAKLLWQDRKSHKRYPPGLAEYLDLLRALSTIGKDEQMEQLKEISNFVYNKEAENQ